MFLSASNILHGGGKEKSGRSRRGKESRQERKRRKNVRRCWYVGREGGKVRRKERKRIKEEGDGERCVEGKGGGENHKS